MHSANSFFYFFNSWLTIFSFVSLFSLPAQAFYTVQDTGDIIDFDKNQFSTQVQFVTNGDDGVNLIGFYDKGVDEESSFRAEVGTGTTDILLGVRYKWVPYPDFDKQPAIGFIFGFHYANFEDENEIALRAIPILSKKLDSSVGLFTPYAALPIGFSNYDDDTETPIQLSLGSRFRHPNFSSCDFNVEVGFELSDAITYISVGAIFPAF